MGEITRTTEYQKWLGEKVTPGNIIGGIDWNMSGGFLMFGGSAQPDIWWKHYKDLVGESIRCPGIRTA